MAQDVDPLFDVAFVGAVDEGGAAVVDGAVEEALEGEAEGEGAGAGDAGADDLDLLCGGLVGGGGGGGVALWFFFFFFLMVCTKGKGGFYIVLIGENRIGYYGL